MLHPARAYGILYGMQNAEQNRLIENLIRLGTIAEVDCAKFSCRVSTAGLTTDWLQWFALRAGTTKEWSPPTVGEQCVIFSVSGEVAAGLVLVGLFSDANPPPSSSADEHLRTYPDGATFSYNHATGAMSVSGIKTLLIDASGSITLKSPVIMLDGKETTSTGKHTIKGLLSYMAGLAGLGGAAGSSISGDMKHAGGSLSSNGVVLDTHKHPGDSGGETGAPNK